jgi:hypothetical protein
MSTSVEMRSIFDRRHHPKLILQGSLVISESNLSSDFSSGGNRVLLVDAPPENPAAVAEAFPSSAIEGPKSFQHGGGLRIFRKSRTHTSQSSKRSGALACYLGASASALWCCVMCWNVAANWRSSRL